MPLIFDAHEDIAYNMLTFGRDYRRSSQETHLVERDTAVPGFWGDSLLGWPDYQLGQVALIFGTLFIVPRQYKDGEWDTQTYATTTQAHTLYQRQIDVYQRLCDENPEKFRLVRSRKDLDDVLSAWDRAPADYPKVTHPVGIVLSMEGAEGIRGPEELEEWWEAGLRLVGPVWAGTRFCGGTYQPGAFSSEGFELLDVMAELRYTLDVSHMSDKSTAQALDYYSGPVIASHSNARALIQGAQNERHLTDANIRKLIERDGVIGILPYNRFLNNNWARSDGRNDMRLDLVVGQMDYICQMAGDARHVSLGSDFDGSFGVQSVPLEINTIADLQKLAPLLQIKGYSNADIQAILGGNWRRHLERNLPS
ncbi:MAG: membrane dipeptidase [Anaerolineaceae bacterium]|nr:membrane dipeptidase [Anaerolineaceae bacterium]